MRRPHRRRHVTFGETLPGLDDNIRAAVARGFGVAVHAIADVGLATALASWQAAATGLEPDHGLRVEHILLASWSDLDEMHRLGVTGVIQPGFVMGMGDLALGLAYDECTWLPFTDLEVRRIPLAASSDSPCTDAVAPIPLSRFGIHRQTTSGKTLKRTNPFRSTWLRLWTAGAADAGEQSNERGRIRPVFRADFVVLDGHATTHSTSRRPG